MKVNERWRVALAGLVAALAIPFLIVDSPAPAEGVETTDVETSADLVAAPVADVVEPEVQRAVEIVVTTTEVTPDIRLLAAHAGTWAVARAQAVEDGLVEASFIPPPSNTNYALLPVVQTTPAPEAPVPVADSTAVNAEPKPADPEPKPADPEPKPADPEPKPADPEPKPADPEPKPADPEPKPADPEPKPADPEPKPADPEPKPADPEASIGAPAAPAQVDGRVPPPAGGPTQKQWNALRRCESTHNYSATSPSGLYRGAYQFSRQTWDWVAAIHWPHLVGVDPIAAAPAWQDVMAYTLYAMRGWDQWPICGKHLL